LTEDQEKKFKETGKDRGKSPLPSFQLEGFKNKTEGVPVTPPFGEKRKEKKTPG